ncbi:MAG: DUF3800 domain-containing protein [Pseudomonas sp.]|uniref:DUF3800 domain-containing protein n=1 Tax=Pseudomonas sp. TaxID=306 RepID=UPI0039822428
MHFYVDESGQTGLNLFDENQPTLFYGVLSSRFDLDVVAKPYVEKLREILKVDRLHAAELGNGQLVKIADKLDVVAKRNELTFDIYKIQKADHAAISFFDQVFDSGMNKAIPFTSYWSPLRYLLLIQMVRLFDEGTLRRAWNARISINKDFANKELAEICSILLERSDEIVDPRARELISDGLRWAAAYPAEIDYNVSDKKEKLQISPNLIGFQSVLHGISARLKERRSEAVRIVVDRQSEFNSAQEYINNFYREAKGVPWVTGPGMPVMDTDNIPDIPITCTPGDKSVGLELVDVYLWMFKRKLEGKSVAEKLYPVINRMLERGRTDEVSIIGLEARWFPYFNNLPPITKKEEDAGRVLRDEQEVVRKKYLDGLS